jgi:hypothetical protein
MFDHKCTACGKRQLVFPGQVTSLVNTAAGIVVSHVCWCGAEQRWVTGKGATSRAAAAIAA